MAAETARGQIEAQRAGAKSRDEQAELKPLMLQQGAPVHARGCGSGVGLA